MLPRLAALSVLLVTTALAVPVATARPCVTNGCRVAAGVYSGKGYMYVGPASPALKNQIAFNQGSSTTPLVQGTCHKSDIPAPFPFRERLDDSQPQWTFAGRPPVIGQTTSYRRKLMRGDPTYNHSYDITVKVKMLTAKSGTVSVSETYVIHSNQEGSGGQYTSTCTATGKFGVKR